VEGGAGGGREEGGAGEVCLFVEMNIRICPKHNDLNPPKLI